MVRWLLEGLLFLGLLFALHLYRTRGLVHGAAPQMSGRLVTGETVSLGQLRGRPVLLQFWATWCGVCTLEQDSIQQIAQRYTVLSVAMEDTPADAIRGWMDERGLSYPVLPDPQGRISARYGVRGVPTSIVIDADGQIRFVTVGYTTEWGLRLRLWWVGV